jgi:hypothetical protein
MEFPELDLPAQDILKINLGIHIWSYNQKRYSVTEIQNLVCV